MRIEEAGVNPLNAKIMAGEFRRILPYTPPFVLGNDLAGVVERVGPAVRGFAPDVGTFAERIAVTRGTRPASPSG